MFSSFAAFQHFHRDVRLYLFAWGLIAFGYFGIFGVLFNLYLLRLGYGPEYIGLLTGAGQLAWGLTALPAGMVGARIGNRNGMIVGLFVAAAATALLLLSQMLPDGFQRGWLAGWWIVSWIGSALLLVNGTPFLVSITSPEERRHSFAFQQALMGLLGFAGSLVAGLLPGFLSQAMNLSADSRIAFFYPLWLTPLTYALAILLLVRMQPASAARQDTAVLDKSTLPVFLIVFIAFVVFLQTLGEGTARAFFNVYMDTALQVPTVSIGLTIGIGQLVPVLSSLATPSVMKRWGAGRAVAFAGFASAFSMLLLALVAHWSVASLGYIGIMAAISVGAISRNIYSQEAVASRFRTTMSAAVGIGLAFGWSAAAALGGYVITGWGYSSLFMLGAAAALASALLLLGYLRLGRKSTNPLSLPVS